jgi:hypothetical protein
MDDCRVLRLRACAVAQPTEAARLNAEVDVVLAARAAGQSQWGSELPPLFLLLVLQCVRWDPAVCSVIRAVCSTWSSIHDALRPGRLLSTAHSAVTMQGKVSWFKSLTELNLVYCGHTVSSVLVELQSMPCLRSLSLPSSCAGRAVDAEAVCAITTLTTLRFEGLVVNEWVLDLSRLTTLTTLHLLSYFAVTDKQVLELSHLTGLTELSLIGCANVTSGPARSEQPHRTRPRRLRQRVGRGAARTEQPHRTHHTHPLRLQQRDGRGEAGAAHRHPQPDDSWLKMRTLPPPYSSCHPAPQRTPRSATVYSASRGGPPSPPCNLSWNTTVLQDQPPRCTTVSSPHTPHHPPVHLTRTQVCKHSHHPPTTLLILAPASCSCRSSSPQVSGPLVWSSPG